jgi:hypothetical protein
MRLASLFAIVALVFASSVAAARSRHESVSVRAIKSGTKVTGFKLKLKLLNHDGYALAAVGLVPRDKATTSLTRQEAIQKSAGVLRHQFPAVTGLTRGETREVTFQVTYGKGNKLKSGQQLSLVTAWASTMQDTSPHVWGAVTANGDSGSHVDTP